MTEGVLERGERPREISKACWDVCVLRVFVYSEEASEVLHCSSGGLIERGGQKLDSEINYSPLWAWKLEGYTVGARMN